MAKGQTQHLTLPLARLEEMLVAPEARPLEGRFEDRPGVERLMDALRAGYTRRLEAVHATLVLDEMPSAEARLQMDAALKALSLHQDELLDEKLATIRRDGLRALGKGLLFVLVCMLISAAVEKTTALPELMRTLISGGFVIAGWVALWVPLELLLYDWWPLMRDRRLYRLIAGMEITIEPAQGKRTKARS
jgi:hypothetical protein